MLDGILNFLITMLALRIIFSLFVRIKSRHELKKQMNMYTKSDNVREQEFNKAIKPKELIKTVKDEYCGNVVPRKDSYIAVVDNKRHYFCSWECRQKYLKEMKQKEENTGKPLEECPN